MDCIEARDKLLEAAEGELEQSEQSLLSAHLAGCPECRAEFEELQRAAEALRRFTPELAPRERYLTPARLRCLLDARAHGPRLFRLFTYRQFIAAAAAAAILISATLIGHNVMRMWPRPEVEVIPEVAQGPAAVPSIPVVLAATAQDEPMSVVRKLPAPSPIIPDWETPGGGARLVAADSPGVRIPVDHAFYDPEESSRWW